MPKSTSSEMKIACALALIVSMAVSQAVPAAGRKDGRTFDGPRIAWDTSTESKIAPRGGYSRVRRLPDGSYVAAFEDRRGNVNFSRSADMVTWSKGITVIPAFVVRSADRDVRVNVANAEIFPLADGTLLCGGNYRPSAEDVYPYSIVVARSEDGGVTWSEPSVLYEAGPRFGDGCWEPSFLQLPDGRVQVYFANENPYRQSDEQEISMLESRDGGRTWSREAVTVSFRKGHRDGMPVAECFGDEVVVVIEDNNIGQFKPYTVRSGLDRLWEVHVDADSEMREYAMSESFPDSVYMGAPYIVRLPGGESLISYQTTAGRTEEWELSCMEVAVGDASARSFTNRTRPFNVPLDHEGKWNAVAVADSSTVIAVSASDKDGQEIAPWVKKGYIFREGIVPRGPEPARILFIGSRSRHNMTVSASMDRGRISMNVNVNDDDVVPGDAAGLLIHTGRLNDGHVTRKSYRIVVSCDASSVSVFRGSRDGFWRGIGGRMLAVSHAAGGTLQDGYSLRILTDRGFARKLRPCFRMTAVHHDASASKETEPEFFIFSDPEIPSTWLKCRIFIAR